MNTMIERFEALLASGRDDALLRFGLGQAYLSEAEHEKARTHLQAALSHNPDYSAAWKLLGRACVALDDLSGAKNAFEQGIAVAERRGDKQAAREMQVFLKRVRARNKP